MWNKRHLLGALTTLQYWIIEILNKPYGAPIVVSIYRQSYEF